MFRGLRGAVSRFAAADGFLMSAGLAFFFLVCVIPIVLLMVSLLGFVLSTEQAANQVVSELARNFPVYRREIARVLLRIVETRGVSGLLGTLVLLALSTQLFSASRLVLHRLIGIRPRGAFLGNLVTDALMVFLLSAFLFLATGATWVLQWVQEFVLQPVGVPVRWIDGTGVAASLALSVAMFHVGYRYVPRRHIRPGAAFRGALLAGVLWEIAKQLFRLYIRKVGIYDQIYGPLGVLVAFVMFAYYSAIVFVFGGAYSAALDAKRR